MIRTQQGTRTPTWTRPRFYGGSTIPELYQFHAEHSPDHPVIIYQDEERTSQTLRFKDVFRAARKVASTTLHSIQEGSPRGSSAIIGILASLDFPTYFTLVLGIMHSGYIPFPLSVRNSADAVADLLRKTSTTVLLVSPDPGMQRLAHHTKEALAAGGYAIDIFPTPVYSDLYGDVGNQETLRTVSRPRGSNNGTAIILHSSGSTSFPKPIPLPHRNLSMWAFAPYLGDNDLAGMRFSMHCVPMFYLMGSICLTYPVGFGAVITVFGPSSPPIVPTPENVLKSAAETECNGLICVPSFLQTWAHDRYSLDALRRFDFVSIGGAALNMDIGELLVEQGVKLFSTYGTTEIGVVVRHMALAKPMGDGKWAYFSISPAVDHVLLPQEGQPGIFELVVLDCPTWAPNIFNTTIEGRPAYATGDLLEAHPSDQGFFRVFGRLDDQIVLSTGEKECTNPVPIEALLVQDSLIAAAVVFGNGRAQVGVLVQPKEPFDTGDPVRVRSFQDGIWPTVERANERSPTHSCIFKEMIVVVDPSRPFQFTPKGTPRRSFCLREYAEEINAVYKNVERPSYGDIPLLTSWDDQSVRLYVRRVVKEAMKTPDIRDDEDLFQQGCDSLRATRIRNAMQRALESSPVAVHDVPQNIVYTHPSITALSAFVCASLAGHVVDQDDEHAAHISRMNTLLDRYSADFPTPKWGATCVAEDGRTVGEVVVITGTTGVLGSHLLSQLLAEPNVARVYALNRAKGARQGSEVVEERQRASFEALGLDAGVLGGDNVNFHAADLTQEDLGLERTLADEIRSSATTIIHCAWQVDFNVTLPSLEPLVSGTRRLVDLALSSSIPHGPRILFASSVSALQNYTSDEPAVESVEYGPEVAIGIGYGESKWVTEQVLQRAARSIGLRTVSVRVGQLSGDSRSGAWNAKEWVPTLVRTAARLGGLPARDCTVSWVPVDVAATALLEMRHSDQPVLHLTSPRPVLWEQVFTPISVKLGVPFLPPKEWVARLGQDIASKTLPAGDLGSEFALHDFFKNAMAAKDVVFANEKALVAAPSLLGSKELGEGGVLRWMESWQRAGVL
ncbi:hypothetical protein V8D89_005369 [Ganoderma adspersum]